MSPQCLAGQHEDCKHRLSYIPDDGVARTMVCPCRCHERAPVAGQAAEEFLYSIAWEYEFIQPATEGTEELKAWLRRKVLTNSKDIADDWLSAIEVLLQTNGVRSLVVRKAAIGKWEVLNG